MSIENIRKAIKLAGSQEQLGRAIGKSQSVVSTWVNRDKRIPGDWVIHVAEAVDWQVTPHELRPDLYPNSDDGLPQSRRTRAA